LTGFAWGDRPKRHRELVEQTATEGDDHDLPVDRIVRWIAWLSEGCGDVEISGGKGAGLARLARAGLPVPPAFCVTTTAFDEVVGRTSRRVEAALAQLPSTLSAGELERAAADARQLILEASAGHPALDVVADAYGELTRDAPGPVAVRSSSALEDADEDSYAGEHDTELWVDGADEVVASVRRCWASLYTARAIRYRMRVRPEQPSKMATVVQRMVDAIAAGVFMTLNPSNGDRSSVVVESVWGVGEPVVSGSITPDRFVLDKVTGDVRRREVAHKARRTVRGSDGPVSVTVPAEQRDEASLTDRQLFELLAMARRIEAMLGRPADGEFAVIDDQIWILQARPETAWSGRLREHIRPFAPTGAVQAVVATLTSSSP
jgi:pyruvate,water dikinase